jgi:hypothetical protein
VEPERPAAPLCRLCLLERLPGGDAMTAAEYRKTAMDYHRGAQKSEQYGTPEGAAQQRGIAKAYDLAADVLEPSEELVEAVARTIYEHTMGVCDDDAEKGWNLVYRVTFKARARAVLAALAARLEDKT